MSSYAKIKMVSRSFILLHQLRRLQLFNNGPFYCGTRYMYVCVYVWCFRSSRFLRVTAVRMWWVITWQSRLGTCVLCPCGNITTSITAVNSMFALWKKRSHRESKMWCCHCKHIVVLKKIQLFIPPVQKSDSTVQQRFSLALLLHSFISIDSNPPVDYVNPTIFA